MYCLLSKSAILNEVVMRFSYNCGGWRSSYDIELKDNGSMRARCMISHLRHDMRVLVGDCGEYDDGAKELLEF
jgi:hypothetical protein